MSAITLKSVPAELVKELKSRASRNHRSLSGEILYRLTKSLENEGGGESALREEASIQADAWTRIGGGWVPDESAADEIAALYAERSSGRDVSF
ncbi:Arc family DNA-binding protein [Haloferula chungangensis]|uniref:Arc family DNA-binding protein n=1 Tax=Haloferula chungangensis TaxID=1048331 RepID=A0ABW2KZU8_9BACT